jgi:cell division protein FtsN
MATEFEPITRKPTTPDPIMRVTDPMVDRPRSSMAPYAIAAAVVVAFALGMMFWNMGDRNKAGLNTAPGVTTGSSTTAPIARPSPSTTDANKTNTK